MGEPSALTLPTFREYFNEWRDSDFAEYYLCELFGIVEPGSSSFIENKGVFYSRNDLCTMFHQTLENLVLLGVLDKNEHEQYRYSRLHRSLQDIAYNK